MFLRALYVDGIQKTYYLSSTDDSWIVYTTYTHSTHDVVIALGLAEESITGPQQIVVPVRSLTLLLALMFWEAKLL
jgi:hypothetical protein